MGRECNIPQQVVASLNSLFENGLLPFGVLEHVVTGGWTLPPADVPGLLDQYGWKDDARREHMQLLLSMVLRAVGDFRSELQHIMELGSAIEMEGRLSRAQERVLYEMRRAMRKHGQALPKPNAADLQRRLEALVPTLSTACVERVEALRHGGSGGLASTTEEEEDEVARFAQRLEAAHIE
jgi:primosomal replication protein N